MTDTAGQIQTYEHGAIERYTASELDQIDRVKHAATVLADSELVFRCETVRLKLMLDGEDKAEGFAPAPNASSRFWDGARAGTFGQKIQEMAEKGDRVSVKRWVDATHAAELFLRNQDSQYPVTNVTRSLPLQSAQELGITSSTLEIYGRADEKTRHAMDFYYQSRKELKADMLKQIGILYRAWPEKAEGAMKMIADSTLQHPKAVEKLISKWEKEKAEERAARRALEHAAELKEAEQQEEETKSYKKEIQEAPSQEKDPNDVTRRRTPTRAYYQSDAGREQVKKVVGDLPDALPGILRGLNSLNRALIDQAELSGVMYNYGEFWSGYDRFALSPGAAQQVWGSKGRLDRMKKLRGLMAEVSGRLNIYIANAAPCEGLEYPETVEDA